MYICLVILLTGCDDYLDVVPDNVATLDHAFRDRTTSLRYLATCYSHMPPLGSQASDPATLGSDEWFANTKTFYGEDFRGLDFRTGLDNAADPIYDYWSDMYVAIRDCNIFLENINKAKGDLPEWEKRRWIAEVKFLKAFYHFYLMRLYGPIPVIRENLPVSSSIEENRVYREPIDDIVNYLISLLDESIPDLPPTIKSRSTELGHVIKPVAMTLKADILVTAASPLYNGNADMNILVNPDGTKLFPEKDETKWVKATVACEEALDAVLGAGHQFYNFDRYTDISDSTKLILSLKQVTTEQWNQEIIWTVSSLDENDIFSRTTPFFKKSLYDFGPYDPHIGPTLATTEFFYSNNGVPIEEDNSYPYSTRYEISTVPQDHKYYALPGYKTMRLHIGREPRYYANIAFDGTRWFGNGRYSEIDRGSDPDDESYVFRMKEGEEQGKIGNLRFTPTGLWAKKTSHIETTHESFLFKHEEPSTWPIYRLSELYLFYAEALNESLSTPDQRVYHAIDQVRIKSGLKGVVESWQKHSKFPNKVRTKEGMRDIIRRERTNELIFEGKRFYDLRRWKTAHIAMNKPTKGFNVSADDTKKFNQIQVLLIQEFIRRDYLVPIATVDIRENTNLVQNPFW